MSMPPYFSKDTVYEADTPPNPPNPHPFRFRILATKQHGPFLLVMIRYLDAKTFGGEKLLVYRATASEFWTRKEIDPHFLGVDGDPIARFPPTPQGREDAGAFIDSMLKKEKG